MHSGYALASERATGYSRSTPPCTVHASSRRLWRVVQLRSASTRQEIVEGPNAKLRLLLLQLFKAVDSG